MRVLLSKRYRRKRGRADLKRRRTSHITVIVAERKEGNSGSKVHPKGLRLGIIKDWDSRWYDKTTVNYCMKISCCVITSKAALSGRCFLVEIERAANRLRISIHTAKPSIVIGHGGTEVEVLRKDLEKLSGKQVNVNIIEIKKPELDAQLVAESVASNWSAVWVSGAMKQAVSRTMRMGTGYQDCCERPPGWAEMARSEWYSEGKVPSIHCVLISTTVLLSKYEYVRSVSRFGFIEERFSLKRETIRMLWKGRG